MNVALAVGRVSRRSLRFRHPHRGARRGVARVPSTVILYRGRPFVNRPPTASLSPVCVDYVDYESVKSPPSHAVLRTNQTAVWLGSSMSASRIHWSQGTPVEPSAV